MGKEQRVLALYDVRGIQKYIYRTSKLKDAMGASRLVEDIIFHALEDACKGLEAEKEKSEGACERSADGKEKLEGACKGSAARQGKEKAEGKKTVSRALKWGDENSPYIYDHTALSDVQVLYIGGGNAFVSFLDASLCREINQRMTKYVMEKTYSLQLAAAYVPMTDDYSQDYKDLFGKMSQVKAEMSVSKPLGTLPIMRSELKTGFPVADFGEGTRDRNREEMSWETYLKWNTKNTKIQEEDIEKILYNLARRGQESRIAVVHIDGNNMGLRIRRLVEHITDYQEAVTKMRQISHNIKYSYLHTFEQMKKEFEGRKKESSLAKCFVRKVVIAGDDITYVCNAHIAMETVAWFCRRISVLTMNAGLKKGKGAEPRINTGLEKGEGVESGMNAGSQKGEACGMGITEADIQEYGFSVCAGIAYIHSHFPFGTAYEVAESCCDIAKEAAKSKEHKAYYKVTGQGGCQPITYQEYQQGMGQSVQDKSYYFERTGNFFDFQICKNIQCLDLKKIRQKEFETSSGESLLLRPYYVPMPREDDPLNQVNGKSMDTCGNYNQLRHEIAYFSNQQNLPRSFAKKIRNTYSLGKAQMGLLASFLDSRGWKMPGGSECAGNMYLGQEGAEKARWYDALEVVDYSLSDSILEEGEEDETKED